jgi:outer membrane receptor protein involved in Fe transport
VRFERFDEALDTLDLLYRFGTKTSRLSGLVGATASRRKQDQVTTGFEVDNRQRATSSALFADLAWTVAPGWQLLAGARLHDEKGRRRFDFAGGAATVDDTIDETLLLPKLGVAWQIDAERSSALTWRRGYNPGGSGIDFISLDTFRFDSEQAEVVELSYRHAPRGGTWSFSANLFASRFDDKQFQYSPSPNSFRIVNYPTARSHGAEFEGHWQATPALRIAGGLGLLRTRIGSGDAALEGNRFGEDPSATVSLGVTWQASAALELSARAQRVGRYFSDFQNDPPARAGGYATLDLGAAYEIGAWTLRAFIDNATDRLAVGRSDGFGGYLLPPRTVGLSASAQF